jgi:hypothetical protein
MRLRGSEAKALNSFSIDDFLIRKIAKLNPESGGRAPFPAATAP